MTRNRTSARKAGARFDDGSKTTTHWRCMECDATGTYEQAMSGGAAERHTKATGHGTTSSLHADAIERIGHILDQKGQP